ncbi:sorting nexin-17 [Cephus cinctus]|uniref:Sorting nexin-17 n=1 Tax=Cephus cinctus TaxID=211228 RepID=A0AAJ7RHM5_CEPCN|nr:sorting nexin-17 [Cephus cinctus]
MHFSIPDTQEFIETTGNAYLGYNVHINGLYHCTVRYKQLHNLHKQLMKDLDVPLPPFPPKKLFPLTITQQEERRFSLEKYIQTIGQNSSINNCELLNGFLLNAQLETAGESTENQSLDVYLMNDCKIILSVSAGENSGQVLRKLCRHIKLPDQYVSYFSLFIMCHEDDGTVNIVRKLQDFESPIITQKNLHATGMRVVLGKSYWDPGYDLELMNDPVAINLLQMQAAAEINRGWIPISSEMRDRLNHLQDNGDKAQYLDIAQSLKYYGYVQFAPCYCDYPQPGCRVLVAMGKHELNLRILETNDKESETTFKITRMHCWRITTLHNGADKIEDNSDCSLELSFEYLMARNQLQWITITSEQAILMSVCLQAMIDELLIKNVGGSKSQEVSGKTWTYIMRDGVSTIVMGSSSMDNLSAIQDDEDINSSGKPEPIMRKLTERLSSITTKKSADVKRTVVKIDRKKTNCDTMENNAFHMIGDDDL